LQWKKRRPPSIPGHWDVQKNGRFPRAQSISETHPYHLYLHQNSHYHPANKQSVLASLIHRIKALCDQESLTQELEFLTTFFKDNGYSPQQIRRTMEPANGPTKPMINPPRLHTYCTPKQHMVDSAEFWPNAMSKCRPPT
jgi:hypothetical protein